MTMEQNDDVSSMTEETGPLHDAALAVSRRIPISVVVAYAVLTVAWAITNPPFAAPDEPDHYVRAIGLAGGQLFGKPTNVPIAELSTLGRRLYDLRNDGAHLVHVPAGLWADGLTCNAFDPGVPADCLESIVPTEHETEQVTLMTGYEPANYLVPGVLARLADDPFTAVRLARLGSGLVCLSFIALAVLLLWARDPWGTSLVGLVAAVTPMVIFTGAIVNPSGPEIASAVAFVAGLLRVTRDGRSPAWVWGALAVSGAALAVSRSPGPMWLVFDCLAVIVVMGYGRARAIVRDARRPALLTTAVIVVASLASAAWQATYGPPSSVGVRDFAHAIPHALDILGSLLDAEVGLFGWLDSAMPGWAVLAWQALVVAILATALLVGDRYRRCTLVAVTIACLGVSAGYAASYRVITGVQDAQGRHLLPIAVAVPLIAGEIVHRNREKLRMLDAHRLFVPVAFTAGALHLVAWYWNARRHGQGIYGSYNLFESPAWSPPLGWPAWTVIVLGAVILLLGAGLRRPWRLVDDAGSSRRTSS